MQFKVGDRVILDNLDGDIPNNPGIVGPMYEMVGQIFTISGVGEDWVYFKNDPHDYVYAKEWLKPASEELIKKIEAENEKAKKTLISKTAINKAITTSRKNLGEKRGTSKSMCDFEIVGIDNDKNKLVTLVHHQAPCHAGLNIYNKGNITVVGAIDWIGNYPVKIEGASRDTYKKYVDYVLNRSPVSDTFLTKNLTAALKHGVLYDVTKGKNQIAVAAVMLRMGQEYRRSLPIYQMMLDKGFSERVAWLMFCGYSPIGNRERYSMNYVGGHNILRTDMVLQKILKFFGPDFKFSKQSPYAKDHSGYRIEYEVDKLKGVGQSWRDFLFMFQPKPKLVWGEAPSITPDILFKIAEGLTLLFEKEEANA